MTDTCRITRVGSGEPVFNPTTGISEPPEPTPVYTGPCRVRTLSLADRPAGAGEHDYTVQDFILSMPITTADVRVDDVVLVTASRLDPALSGKRFVVGPVARGSQQTARRFLAREVTS